MLANWPSIELPCNSALESRRRAICLLPSLGLLENGTRRRAARSGRVCRRDRLGHSDLHRHQRRAAAVAALPEQRALRVAIRRQHDRPEHDDVDVGARAAGLRAADHELRRVRLVPHRPIPHDGPWRAAIRPRRGGDAGTRATARLTAPRAVVRRRHERRHLERPVAPPRRRARHHRQRHHARRTPVHDHRRHAANVSASAREPGGNTRRHRGVDSARSVSARREPRQRVLRRVRPPQTRGVAGTGEGGRQASRHRRRRHRSRTLSELHGGRGRPARGDDRDGRLDRPSPAADPARRRRPPAAHCLCERRYAAAGTIRCPRPRDGDSRRARCVATAARAALLRRRRARVGRRRRRRRRHERDLRPADPGGGVRIHLARR